MTDSAQWAPDGERVAFLADRDGETSLAVAGRSSSDAAVARGSPTRGRAARLVPGRLRDRRCLSTRDASSTAPGPYRWTRPFPAADGLGPLEDPPQLRLIDVATGEGRWLTDDDWRWATPRWSPDGTAWPQRLPLDPDRPGRRAVPAASSTSTAPWSPAVPGGRGVVPALAARRPSRRVGRRASWSPSGQCRHALRDLRVPRFANFATPDLLGDVFGDCPAELADTYEQVLLANGDSVVVRIGAGAGWDRAWSTSTRCRSTQSLTATFLFTCRLATGRLVFTRAVARPVPRTCRGRLAAASPTVERAAPRVRRWHARTCRRPTVHRRVRGRLADSTAGSCHRLEVAGRSLPSCVIHGGPHFTYGEASPGRAGARARPASGCCTPNQRGSTGYGDAFAHAVHGDWADGPTRRCPGRARPRCDDTAGPTPNGSASPATHTAATCRRGWCPPRIASVRQ